MSLKVSLQTSMNLASFVQKLELVKNMIFVQGLEVERAGDIQLLLETFYSGRKQALSTEVSVVSMWKLSQNKLPSLLPIST